MADDDLRNEKSEESDPTLEELEGVQFREPHLVTTWLRKKPVGQFSVEDFRIMIWHNIGLFHPLPLALAVLEADPLAEGDLYAGDLLSAVLRVDRGMLRRVPESQGRLLSVARRAEALIEAAGGSGDRGPVANLLRAIKEFTAEQISTR
jgi:hypothetical protein